MTGIGYDSKALTAHQLTPPASLADLFTIATAHPKNVSFLTESRDTFGLTMLKLSLDPSQVTVATLQQAHDAMRPLVDAGVRFADNSYLQDFAQGKTWVAMVWSGDLAGSGTADEHFVFPTEGVMIWSDNMLIPKGAQNQPAAQAMMNYVYDPTVAGNLANAIYYVSPVKGADAVVKQLNASAPSIRRCRTCCSRALTSWPSSTPSRRRWTPTSKTRSITCTSTFPAAERRPSRVDGLRRRRLAPSPGPRAVAPRPRGTGGAVSAADAGHPVAAHLLHLPDLGCCSSPCRRAISRVASG